VADVTSGAEVSAEIYVPSVAVGGLGRRLIGQSSAGGTVTPKKDVAAHVTNAGLNLGVPSLETIAVGSLGRPLIGQSSAGDSAEEGSFCICKAGWNSRPGCLIGGRPSIITDCKLEVVFTDIQSK
jgi:hypothetical protein